MPPYSSTERRADPLERAHRARSQHPRHIAQEAPLLLAEGGIACHVGAEVVHLPIGGDREVQRVEHAVDEHDPVLARHAVRAARVEILDREQLLARERGERAGEGLAPLHPHEVPPRVKAGTSQQQRKLRDPNRRGHRGPIPDSRAIASRCEARSHRGWRPSAARCRRVPSPRTRAGRLMTGAVLRAASASARSSARAQRSASPIAFMISACGGNGCSGS